MWSNISITSCVDFTLFVICESYGYPYTTRFRISSGQNRFATEGARVEIYMLASSGRTIVILLLLINGGHPCSILYLGEIWNLQGLLPHVRVAIDLFHISARRTQWICLDNSCQAKVSEGCKLSQVLMTV